MGNSYLKYILLFVLLFCFTANTSFANVYSNKAATSDNTKEKGTDENPELKLELGITQFSRACAQLFLIDNEQLKIINFKIQLPNSFHSLPELPPRK